MTDEQRKLVEENIGLVGFAITKYVRSALGDDDVYQVGCLGLIEAAKRYDSSRGTFSAFAVMWITGHIYKYFRSQKSRKELINYNARHLEEVIYDNNTSEKITLIEHVCTTTNTNNEDFFNNAMVQEVISILERYPENECKAFLLYHYLNFTQPEISRILTISQASVSRYLTRAMRKLKMHYDIA